jgi:hypothetical protein
MLSEDTIIQMYENNVLICEDTLVSFVENNIEDDEVIDALHLLTHYSHDEIEVATFLGYITLKVKR